MKKTIIIIVAISVFCFTSCVVAIGGDGYTDHMHSPSPMCGSENITITQNGVQTCVTVILDADCEVNLSFQWINYTDWTWYEYGNYSEQKTGGEFCAWHNNVSCYTEGDWRTEYHFWKVVADFNCTSGSYQEILFCYFVPELCDLFYIYPAHNSTNVTCPPCVSLCVGINNPLGNLMNLTFWSNLSGDWDWFYLGNENGTYENVENGTYCFYVPFFSRYNYTYFWYVNITDVTTHDYVVSDIYHFTTQNMSECPCGEESIIALISENTHERDYVVGIVGILGIIGVLGYLKSRKQEKEEEDQDD